LEEPKAPDPNSRFSELIVLTREKENIHN
jgi:hypothetical protein